MSAPAANRARDGIDLRFARAVLSAREARGISQAGLSAEMAALGWKFHAQTIYRIETGARKVPIGEALALASLLEIDLIAFPASCETCNGRPPAGFICGTCREGAQ